MSDAFPFVSIEPRFAHVRRVPVRIQGLPAALNGLTIAHLTDIHRSRLVSSEHLSECIAIRSTLHAPRSPPAEMVHDCGRCLSQSRAKSGVFATLGNHDNWYNRDAVANAIQSVGIPVLRNGGQAANPFVGRRMSRRSTDRNTPTACSRAAIRTCT